MRELAMKETFLWRDPGRLRGVLRLVLRTASIRNRSLTVYIEKKDEFVFFRMRKEDIEFYPEVPVPRRSLQKISISAKLFGVGPDFVITPPDDFDIDIQDTSSSLLIKNFSCGEGELIIGFPFEIRNIERIKKEEPCLAVTLFLNNSPDEICETVELSSLVKKRASKPERKEFPKTDLLSPSLFICREKDRRLIERERAFGSTKKTYHSLVPTTCTMNSIQAAMVTLEGEVKDSLPLHFHPGEEVMFVLSGKIQVEMLSPQDSGGRTVVSLAGEEHIRLYRGKYNALQLASHIPHRKRNMAAKSQLIIVYYEPKSLVPKQLERYVDEDGITIYDPDEHDFNNVILGFGCNLRLYMERRGFTVSELSSRIDVSEEEILNWLKFSAEPPQREVIDKIKTVLKMKFPIVFGDNMQSYGTLNTNSAPWESIRTDHNDPNQYCRLLEVPGTSELHVINMEFAPTPKRMVRFARHNGEEFVYVRHGKLNLMTIDESLTGMSPGELQSVFNATCITYKEALEKLKAAGHTDIMPKMYSLSEGESAYLNSDVYHAAYAPEAGTGLSAIALTVHFDETRQAKTKKVREGQEPKRSGKGKKRKGLGKDLHR